LLDPARVRSALEYVIADLDYDIHKNLLCGEDYGEDHYEDFVDMFITSYETSGE
jgi:hypothetical protein